MKEDILDTVSRDTLSDHSCIVSDYSFCYNGIYEVQAAHGRKNSWHRNTAFASGEGC